MDRRSFLRTGVGVVAGIGAAGALSACGGDGGTGPGGGNGTSSADHTVQVDDNVFNSSNLTIQQGESVGWVHVGNAFHTITPDGHGEWQDQDLPAGSSEFVVTFNNPGTFDYYCEPHRSHGMVGTITVQ